MKWKFKCNGHGIQLYEMGFAKVPTNILFDLIVNGEAP